MGWPVLSLGRDFYVLVMGIWCSIVSVFVFVLGGGGVVRVSMLAHEKADVR